MLHDGGSRRLILIPADILSKLNCVENCYTNLLHTDIEVSVAWLEYNKYAADATYNLPISYHLRQVVFLLLNAFNFKYSLWIFTIYLYKQTDTFKLKTNTHNNEYLELPLMSGKVWGKKSYHVKYKFWVIVYQETK